MAKSTPKTSSLSDSPTFTPISQEMAAPPRGSENVQLVREAFDRKEFNDTINTNFTQLGLSQQSDRDLSFFDPNLASVEDFFNIYNNLFFIIPKYGEINSHEYLIKESSDYIDYKANQEEIQALLDEIAELRETNLQLQVDMASILGAKQEIDRAIEDAREVESGT